MNKLRSDMAQRFLDALNQERIPWKACWQGARPLNAATGKLYRGVNAMFLSYIADEMGYTDPRWCTYNQAREKGWQVRRGEKSASVEYWAYYDLKEKKLLSWQDARDKLKADPDYEKNLQLRCRVYSVFNAQQIDGIPALEERPRTDIGTLREQRDTLVRNMGIGYQEHGSQAYYSPRSDTVTLPPEASFHDPYSYMATFLHECGHATGHPSRLNRDLLGGFGSPEYAKEELRAEIASAFTAQALGLQLTDSQLQYHMDQHAAYIQSWAAALRDAPEELFRAIKAAEEISDYLIEKGEFELEHTERRMERSTTAELIMVAIESTDDYTDANFHQDLINIDHQNPDGSWGTVVDRYRLVKIGDTGRIEALDDDLVFPTKAQAKAVAESIPYARLVDYDTLIHEAGKDLAAKFTLEEIHDSSDLRLRFHGYGKIAGYSSAEARPWQPQVGRIQEIVIGDGITEIGRNVLNNYPAVEKITWPRSVTHSGPYALWNCPNLKEIAFTGASQRGLDIKQIGSPGELSELATRYPELCQEQLEEVAGGIRDGLQPAQVDVYARPEFTAIQMNSLRYSICAGLTPAQIELQANPAFDSVQMDVIRTGFQSGMSMEQVRSFAKPEIPAQKMLDAYWAIREGREWSALAGASLTDEEAVLRHAADQAEKEFWEMDSFLKKGGDIAELADPYEWDLGDYGP